MEKLIKLMDYSKAIAMLGLASAVTCYASLEIYLDHKKNTSFKEEKILSERELEMVVQEEAEKLQVNLSKVHFSSEPKQKLVPTLDGYQQPAGWVWKEKGFYQLYLKRDVAIRTTVRHELYHIARGHLDREKMPAVLRIMLSAFVNETQANAYALLGIKL